MSAIVRGSRLYAIRPEGKVAIYRRIAERWVYQTTVARDFYGLPSDIRFPCNRIDSENARRRAGDSDGDGDLAVTA